MAECRRLEDRHADCSGERFRSQRAVHGLGLEMQIFLCIKIGIITEIFHIIFLHLFGHAFPHIQLLYKTLFIIYSLKVLFILQKVLFYLSFYIHLDLTLFQNYYMNNDLS